MRVLVVEDHELLARALVAGLHRRGMIVDLALDGDDALARLGATATTWSSWTGTSQAFTATRSVAGSRPSEPRAAS